MAFNLLPLELLPFMINHISISSLCALSYTCRSLNVKQFLTPAIDAFIASHASRVRLWAALSDCPVIMRRCLDIDRSMSRGFLILLVYRVSGRTMQAALDSGASMDEVDRLGFNAFNALESAMRWGNTECVRVLLAAGAGPKGWDWATLMGFAQQRGYGEIEGLLLNQESNIIRRASGPEDG